MRLIQIISIIITIMLAINTLNKHLDIHNKELQEKTVKLINKIKYNIKINNFNANSLKNKKIPDEWGTEIKIDLNKKTITSAGGDKIFNTPDDITVNF